VYPDVERNAAPPIAPWPGELDRLTPELASERVQKYETDLAAYDKWQTTHNDLEASFQKQLDDQQKEFQKKVDKQGTTVALISLLIAVVITSASLLYSGRLAVIAEGLLLGGVFTLIYSIGSAIAHAQKIIVLTVGIGLVVTIVIGYMKFVKPATAGHIPPAVQPPA
jgi:hypothetical protein